MTSSPAHGMSIDEAEIEEGNKTVLTSEDPISESEGSSREMVPSVAPTTVADALLEAHFVKLVVYPSADCVVATALLRSALTALETPYHITAARTPDEAEQAAESTESTTTVLSIGVNLPLVERPKPVGCSADETENTTESNDGFERSRSKTTVNDDGTGADANVANDVTEEEQNDDEDDNAGVDSIGSDHADPNINAREENEAATVNTDDGQGPENEEEGQGNTVKQCQEKSKRENLFDELNSVPPTVPIRRNDAEARAEAQATNGAIEKKEDEDSKDTVRSASQADPYRHLHPAKRGVKMATEAIERTAIGSEPLPPEREDRTAVGVEKAEDTMWPLAGFSWEQQRLRIASRRHRHTDRQPIDETGYAETNPTGTDQVDRSPSIKEADAVAGQHPPDQNHDTDQNDSDLNDASQSDSISASASKNGPETDEKKDDKTTNDEDGTEIGTAQFISDGGQTVSSSVSPGALLHVDTQLHEQDRDTTTDTETVGNVSAGVSASIHAASTVASLSNCTETITLADPVCTLAGMMMYSAGANADFDLGNKSTWPTHYGARKYCKRAQTQGITSEIGLGTPLSSTPSAVQHTTFIHSDFTGSTANIARFMQSCPTIDVFPDSEDDWEKFSDNIQQQVQPDRVDRDDSPRFTQSLPSLHGLFLGCHRLPENKGYAFPTVEGYADILETLSRNGHISQAVSVAAQIGVEATNPDDTGAEDAALTRWKDIGERLHEYVQEAEQIEYNEDSIDGVAYKVTGISNGEGDEEPVGLDHIAILIDQYRSGESPTIVVSKNEAAAVGSCEGSGERVTARMVLADTFGRSPETIGADGNIAFLAAKNDDTPFMSKFRN